MTEARGRGIHGRARGFAKPIVTEVVPLKEFWPAESYHKDYYEHHKDEGYCRLVIAPKIEKVKKIVSTA